MVDADQIPRLDDFAPVQPEVKKRSTPILSLVKPRAKAGAKAKAKTTAKPKAAKKACAKSAQPQATAKPPAKVSPPKKAERKPKSKIVADKSKVPPKVSSAPVPKRTALKGWRWKVAGLAAIALLAVNWVPLHAGVSMALLDRGLKAWDSRAIESYVDVSGLKSSLSQSERAALATPLDLDRLICTFVLCRSWAQLLNWLTVMSRPAPQMG